MTAATAEAPQDVVEGEPPIPPFPCKIETVYVNPEQVWIDGTNSVEVTPEAAQGMAATFMAQGQLQPITLTDIPKGAKKVKADHKYMLVFGHLRVAGAEIVVQQTGRAFPLRAQYLSGVSPAQVAAWRAGENLGRRVLNPMQEAESIAVMIAAADDDDIRRTLGIDPAAEVSERSRFVYVGKMLGWSEKRVAERAFLTRLSPKVQGEVRAGRVPLPYARALATLSDHDDQNRLLTYAAADPDGSRHRPLSYLEKEVAEACHAIRAIPWVEDMKIDKLPACSTCPDNSANRPSLFAAEEGAVATCLRPACFNSKRDKTERLITLTIDRTRKEMVKGKEIELTATGLADICPPTVKLAVFVRRAKAHIDAAAPAEPTEAATKAEAKEQEEMIPWGEQPDRVAEAAVQEAINKSFREYSAPIIKLLSDPARSLLLSLIMKHEDATHVTECYMGDAIIKRRMGQDKWKRTLKRVRVMIKGPPKAIAKLTLEMWAATIARPADMDWRQIVSHNQLPIVFEQIGGLLGGVAPADPPDLVAIRQAAYDAQVEKLASKRKGKK